MPEKLADFSADEIADMPLDRLSLLVLEDAIRVKTWNWRNWILGYESRDTGGKPTRTMLAISEAWNWLIGHGLVSTSHRGHDFNSFQVTRAGHSALERGLPFIKAAIRLDVQLVPVLESRVRPLFLMGDYEVAALAAMREVEIAVRTRSGLSKDLLGTALMQEAFKGGGPLNDSEMHQGESVAQMQLFAGAIGLFKNPPSHRRVDYDDPTQASEVVLLADLLLRLLEATPTGP